jgi:hypothetical protein
MHHHQSRSNALHAMGDSRASPPESSVWRAWSTAGEQDYGAVTRVAVAVKPTDNAEHTPFASTS